MSTNFRQGHVTADTDQKTQSSLNIFVETLTKTQQKIHEKFKNENRDLRDVFSWSAPPIRPDHLIAELTYIVKYVENHNFDESEILDTKLHRWSQFLNNWCSDTLPNLYSSSWLEVISGFWIFTSTIRRELESFRVDIPIEELQKDSKSARRRLDALNKRLVSMEGNLGNLDLAVSRILEADSAAQQLPETLSSLKEAEVEVSHIQESVRTQNESISKAWKESQEHSEYVSETRAKIDEILRQCDRALASSTSTGLAKSFNDRKIELQKIGGAWTIGLLLALVGAVYAAFWRAEQIFELMKLGLFSDTSVILVNMLISLALIGAPVWFAWLATKQIGYYFRLSEDYGFKASISASYEGFRREAEQQDADLEKRILTSTIDRYDEPPLRFVDGRVSGSPIHEVIQSAEFRSALKHVPDFAKDVISLAKGKLAKTETISQPIDKVSETVSKSD